MCVALSQGPWGDVLEVWQSQSSCLLRVVAPAPALTDPGWLHNICLGLPLGYYWLTAKSQGTGHENDRIFDSNSRMSRPSSLSSISSLELEVSALKLTHEGGSLSLKSAI